MDSPQRGTVDAAMEVKTFIEESVRLKQCTVIVSLDAKGSFIYIYFIYLFIYCNWVVTR
jgi:hypothetical protein